MDDETYKLCCRTINEIASDSGLERPGDFYKSQGRESGSGRTTTLILQAIYLASQGATVAIAYGENELNKFKQKIFKYSKGLGMRIASREDNVGVVLIFMSAHSLDDGTFDVFLCDHSIRAGMTLDIAYQVADTIKRNGKKF